MKLIHCTKCGDIVALRYEWRTCECGHVGGKYKANGHDAIVTRYAIPIGINNASLVKKIRERLYGRLRKWEGDIIAWVFDEGYERIEIGGHE